LHIIADKRREDNSRELMIREYSRDRLMPWSGTGSFVTGHAGHGTGQLNDGSRGSQKCDPLSALLYTRHMRLPCGVWWKPHDHRPVLVEITILYQKVTDRQTDSQDHYDNTYYTLRLAEWRAVKKTSHGIDLPYRPIDLLTAAAVTVSKMFSEICRDVCMYVRTAAS